MENNTDTEQIVNTRKKKRPKLLIVLLVLSGFYITTNTYGIIQDFINGPLTQEQVDEQLVTVYTSINDLQSEGASEKLIRSLKTMIANTKYINDKAFYLYNSLTLISLILGAVSIVFMFKLRKIGFHLYIIYSLSPIISMYIVFPMNLVSSLSVIFSLLIATLFALLYGRNLKYMH